MQKETLKLIRGDDESRRLIFQTQDGEPLNLTGARFDLQAKVNGEVVIHLSTEDGTIRIEDTAIVLDFAHEMTEKVDWKLAQYDLQLTINGKRKTLLGGKIKLIQDITEG